MVRKTLQMARRRAVKKKKKKELLPDEMKPGRNPPVVSREHYSARTKRLRHEIAEERAAAATRKAILRRARADMSRKRKELFERLSVLQKGGGSTVPEWRGFRKGLNDLWGSMKRVGEVAAEEAAARERALARIELDNERTEAMLRSKVRCELALDVTYPGRRFLDPKLVTE